MDLESSDALSGCGWPSSRAGPGPRKRKVGGSVGRAPRRVRPTATGAAGLSVPPPRPAAPAQPPNRGPTTGTRLPAAQAPCSASSASSSLVSSGSLLEVLEDVGCADAAASTGPAFAPRAAPDADAHPADVLLADLLADEEVCASGAKQVRHPAHGGWGARRRRPPGALDNGGDRSGSSRPA